MKYWIHIGDRRFGAYDADEEGPPDRIAERLVEDLASDDARETVEYRWVATAVDDADIWIDRDVIRVDPPEPRCSGPRHWWTECGAEGAGVRWEVCCRCGIVRRTIRRESRVEYPAPTDPRITAAADAAIVAGILEYLAGSDTVFTSEDIVEDRLISDGVAPPLASAAAAAWVADLRAGEDE